MRKKFIAFFLAFVTFFMSLPIQSSYALSIDYKPLKQIPVLLIHGYNTDSKSWEETAFCKRLETDGVLVTCVNYGQIDPQYGQLSKNDITSPYIMQKLEQEISKYPKDTKFDVVVHSMGGLYIRWYLLTHSADRSKIRRVIFVGTPNHGSPQAMMNRMSSMLMFPSSYFDKKALQDIEKYKQDYESYTNYVINEWNNGKPDNFKKWMKKKHPEVYAEIQARESEKVNPVKPVGNRIVPGGLPYRYSGAFEEFMKMMVGRMKARSEVLFFNENELVNTVDGGKIKDKLTKYLGEIGTTTFVDEPHSKDNPDPVGNIVQDRLMLQRFKVAVDIDKEGKQIYAKYLANPFLETLEQQESAYRLASYNSNEYFPQYITIPTKHWIKGSLIELLSNNLDMWDDEPNDTVVPVSSLSLDLFLLDRQYYDSSQDVAHTNQPEQIELLRSQYEDPLTGVNDIEKVFDLSSSDNPIVRGRAVILTFNKNDEGKEYKLKVSSSEASKVRLLKRNQFQTWDAIEGPYPMRKTLDGFAVEVTVKVDSDYFDYVLVSDKEYLKVEKENSGEPLFLSYDYLISPITSGLISNHVEHSFRIYDAKSESLADVFERDTASTIMKNFDEKDFIVKDSNNSVYPFFFRKTSQKINNGSNIVLTLDYSGSMQGRPLFQSMAAAEKFIKEIDPSKDVSIGVVGFSDTATVLTNMTKDFQEASKTPYVYMSGGTALYDAIIKSCRLIENDSNRKKAIIVMTDGSDNMSSYTIDQAIETAKDNNIAVYIVCLGGNINRDAIERIANETRGGVFYTYDGAKLSDIYKKKLNQIDTIYTIGYKAPLQPPVGTGQISLINKASNEGIFNYSFGNNSEIITSGTNSEEGISEDIVSTQEQGFWDKMKSFWRMVFK